MVDVEPIDGIDQTQTRNLNKVIKAFAPVAGPARDVIGQRQAPLNDGLALATMSARSKVECLQVAKHV